MFFALAVGLGAAMGVVLLAALTISGVSFWLIASVRGAVAGLPVVGGGLAHLLDGINGGLADLARVVVRTATALVVRAAELIRDALNAWGATLTGALTAVVNGVQAQLGGLTSVLSLAVLPPIEREIPGWLKHLDDELKALPNEPAFRAGGPLAILLRWVNLIWAAVGQLGPFVRLVALPVGLAVAALWGLLEILGRITRLETVQAGLVGFTQAIRHDQLAAEARSQQMAIAINVLQSQTALLQVDLERERAARVALATQQDMARHALQTALEAQRQADKAQWSPLLILGILAALGASGVQVLRKTAECDPCLQIDQSLSDLPYRVAWLEAVGEW